LLKNPATTSFLNSYTASQARPVVENALVCLEQTGGMRKTKLGGLAKLAWQFLRWPEHSIFGGSAK
jgi:hypothetical protein